MERLPDDLVLELGGLMDMDCFLAFQATNRRIHYLLRSRNTGMMIAVARNTFPNQKRLMARQGDELADITWLKDLRYRQLAAIVVEHHDCEKGISAEDELGDRVRRIVAAGWRVAARLAHIAREAREPADGSPFASDWPLHLDHISGLSLPLTDENLRHAVHVELEIAHRWQTYIASLSIEELQGLKWLWQDTLPSVLSSEKPEVDRWHTIFPNRTFSMSAWTMWIVFHAGPQIFWHAWWTQDRVGSSRSSLLPDWIHGKWEATHRVLAFIQEEACRQVEDALRRRQEQISSAIAERSYHLRPSLDLFGPHYSLWHGLSARTRPIAEWRSSRKVTLGEPSVLLVLQHAPYSQYVDWGALDLVAHIEKQDQDPRVCYMRPRPRGPPSPDKRMEMARSHEEWEKDLLDDIRAGLFTLPQPQLVYGLPKPCCPSYTRQLEKRR